MIAKIPAACNSATEDLLVASLDFFFFFFFIEGKGV